MDSICLTMVVKILKRTKIRNLLIILKHSFVFHVFQFLKRPKIRRVEKIDTVKLRVCERKQIVCISSHNRSLLILPSVSDFSFV